MSLSSSSGIGRGKHNVAAGNRAASDDSSVVRVGHCEHSSLVYVSEGHSASYLPDCLTIPSAFCFWHCIINSIKYITVAEYQLSQYLVTGYMTLEVYLMSSVS